MYNCFQHRLLFVRSSSLIYIVGVFTLANIAPVTQSGARLKNLHTKTGVLNSTQIQIHISMNSLVSFVEN